MSMEEQRARQEEEARKAVAASVAESDVGVRLPEGSSFYLYRTFFFSK